MHRHDVGCFVHIFPFSCSVQWYAYHAYLCHPLALCASLHTCLQVHAWVFLASVSSVLQHNEVMDIRSKPTFIPLGHHLLFAFFLVSLLACWLTFFLLSHATLAISILLVCFAPFSIIYASFPFHCLSSGFLSLPSHVRTGARTHRARAWSPRCRQKGRGCKCVDMSQVVVVSRFRSLAFPFGYVLF